MKIIVHTSDDAPPQLRAIAHFIVGKSMLPVRIVGEDAATARAKAEEFWHSEKAKWVKRLNRKEPPPVEKENTPSEAAPVTAAPPTEREDWLSHVAEVQDTAAGLPPPEPTGINEAVVAEIKREVKAPKKLTLDLDDLL